MDKLYEIGNVSLKWLGQMGFLIEADNIKLYIDYFASPDNLRQTPVPIFAGELKDVDVFLGTHDHLDHIDHEAWKIWAKTNPDAKYFLNIRLSSGDIKEGKKRKFGMDAAQGE